MQRETILKEMEKAYMGVAGAFRYGSQVCGYSTEDSDHDVLVVLNEYAPGVKYTYIDSGGVEIAFLAVSKEVFEDDVRQSAYGGFIADRLLNPIKPLINEEYIRTMEVERKRGIVEWETTKLILKKGEMTRQMKINIMYYPYKKWGKMVRLYPPYKYSIENTLRSDLRDRNLGALMPGFEKALKAVPYLSEVEPDWYRIDPGYIDKVLGEPMPGLERIRMIEHEIEDLVARYLTHKRAGDSDRELILKELFSKVRREVKHIQEKKGKGPLVDPEGFLKFSS